MRGSSQNLRSSLVWESADDAFDYQSLLIIIGELLLVCSFIVASSVEYLLSSEFCNRTCEVGNGWCEIRSKMSHSVD